MQYPVDRFDGELFRIVVFTHPFKEFFVFIMLRIPDHLQQTIEPSAASAIFWRAGAYTARAQRIGHVWVYRQTLFEDYAMLPTVAEVVRITDLCPNADQFD